MTADLKARLAARTRQIELPSKRMFDGPLVNPDGPEALARIEALEAERDRFLDMANRSETAWHKACARAEKAEAERNAALKECSEWARQAGEPQGRLEMSEAAGVVEGWRERAERAEGLLREMFEEGPVQVALAGNPLAIDRLESSVRSTLRAIRGEG